MIETHLAFPLTYRPAARAGYAITAVLSLGFVAVGGWFLVWDTPNARALPMTVGLIALYGWVGLAALDVARARAARVVLEAGGVVVEHPALLNAPIAVARENLRAVLIDPRPDGERRIAATTRRNVVASASFLDASIPVVSPHPSSHSTYGAAAAPNVVLLFAEPVLAPRVRLGVRLLLRVATGKTGRYRGPRTGRPMQGVRLVVADAVAFARALEPWGIVGALPRDARYLAPVRPKDRRRAAKERLVMAGVVAGVLTVILLARLAR